MTKERLSEYRSCAEYVSELEGKSRKLEEEIRSLAEEVGRMERRGTVTDAVMGGDGNRVRFRVEGIPSDEYRNKKTLLELKQMAYGSVLPLLEEQREELMSRMVEVERFIARIDDIHVRRIVSLRFVEARKWREVADMVGGGNSEDGVKKAFYRYMESVG